MPDHQIKKIAAPHEQKVFSELENQYFMGIQSSSLPSMLMESQVKFKASQQNNNKRNQHNVAPYGSSGGEIRVSRSPEIPT